VERELKRVQAKVGELTMKLEIVEWSLEKNRRPPSAPPAGPETPCPVASRVPRGVAVRRASASSAGPERPSGPSLSGEMSRAGGHPGRDYERRFRGTPAARCSLRAGGSSSRCRPLWPPSASHGHRVSSERQRSALKLGSCGMLRRC
jgi:hypothetical protein